MAVKSIVKSVDHQVKEYVKKISEEDLRWLSVRFKERIGSDLAEALLLIQDKYGDINRLLANAPNGESVYEVADIVDKHIQDELKKRTRPAQKKEL